MLGAVIRLIRCKSLEDGVFLYTFYTKITAKFAPNDYMAWVYKFSTLGNLKNPESSEPLRPFGDSIFIKEKI